MFSTRWIVFVALVVYCNGSVNLFRGFRSLRWSQHLSSSSEQLNIESYWFPQILDHFQPTDNRTWNQRYSVARDYYKTGGPVFLMIGGEDDSPPDQLVTRRGRAWAWAEYAKQHNALMIVVQHRYYGESQPFKNDLSVENLKYLSSEQALADLAYFITTINQEFSLPANTKWVAFGGSYPGNLAAWLRYKYPHLVHAAVASSAPVLAKVDFPEYLDVVKDSLATYSVQCVEEVKAANREIITLLQTQNGRETIEEEFRFAEAMRHTDQYGNIIIWADSMSGGSDYQWTYQTCTEFGYFQTSETTTALFGEDFPVEYYIKKCRDLYGEQFTEEFVNRAVARTNMMYGGLDLPATRVVYVHGSVDPWHKLGITQTRIPESPVIFIDGTSHCADMHPSQDNDPPALTAAREEISALIGAWLREP